MSNVVHHAAASPMSQSVASNTLPPGTARQIGYLALPGNKSYIRNPTTIPTKTAVLQVKSKPLQTTHQVANHMDGPIALRIAESGMKPLSEHVIAAKLPSSKPMIHTKVHTTMATTPMHLAMPSNSPVLDGHVNDGQSRIYAPKETQYKATKITTTESIVYSQTPVVIKQAKPPQLINTKPSQFHVLQTPSVQIADSHSPSDMMRTSYESHDTRSAMLPLRHIEIPKESKTLIHLPSQNKSLDDQSSSPHHQPQHHHHHHPHVQLRQDPTAATQPRTIDIRRQTYVQPTPRPWTKSRNAPFRPRLIQNSNTIVTSVSTQQTVSSTAPNVRVVQSLPTRVIDNRTVLDKQTLHTAVVQRPQYSYTRNTVTEASTPRSPVPISYSTAVSTPNSTFSDDASVKTENTMGDGNGACKY